MRFVAVLTLVAGLLTALPESADAGGGGSALSILVTSGNGLAPLAGATVQTAGRTATTDGYGRALIADVTPGTVSISHPRFESRDVEWTGAGDRFRVALGSPLVRAIHVNGSLPGTSRWNQLLALADSTAVNAFMLDMKDESGRVFPTTSSSWAAAAGAELGWWDMPTVVDELHGRGLSVIVRIVAFQDPVAGRAIPSIAAYNTATGGPLTRSGQVFLDPTDAGAREYALQLAAEVCAAGADEVQFDYVRFPDGSKAGIRFDGGSGTSESVRTEAIRSFLAEARALMPGDCRVAADIFGFITSIPGDGGIGQQLEVLAAEADVLSPMVYPNHWGRGWFGFSVPANHPGPVVAASMGDARDRVGSMTTLRAWLQDFGGYGTSQVRAQIHAADDLGMGWMVWNAGSVYTPGGIPTDGELATPADPPAPVHETLPSSGFWDVPDGARFVDDIDWLADEGITRGCNPPWRDEFCPDRTLTRAEAAAMLSRALDLPASTVDAFTDDDGLSLEPDINALAAAGITRGCSPTTFCPRRQLTRAEMAAFTARALDLPFVDADTFTDDDGHRHERDIERLAAVGITRGCSPTTFCPDQAMPREQAAAFLHRALG